MGFEGGGGNAEKYGFKGGGREKILGVKGEGGLRPQKTSVTTGSLTTHRRRHPKSEFACFKIHRSCCNSFNSLSNVGIKF